MANIHEPDAKFNFAQLTMNSPVSAPGGIHLSKIFINKVPLYIQAPLCKTKQGVVKNGKKMYSDLLFSNDHEEFIIWIETLETTVKSLLFQNRAKWFDNDLMEDDIETYFLPTIKMIKAGRTFVLRAFMQPDIKAYDDSQNNVDLASIVDSTQLITILEFQGVRCSAKSFQLEIEIKQIMVMKPVELFNKCIINVSKSATTRVIPEVIPEVLPDVIPEVVPEVLPDVVPEVVPEVAPEVVPDVVPEVVPEVVTNAIDTLSQVDKIDSITEENLEPLPKEIQNQNELCEYDIDTLDLMDADTIQIKDKSEVYYNMYRDARRKAKLAKSLALSSFLEAKRIKNLYMLEDIDDSDSDLEDLEDSLADMENDE